MSDELIEGLSLRNRPPEPPAPAEPPASGGRKSRLKGKSQPKAEDEKSGPYVTLVPPDEAGDLIRAQADEPTLHKGMKPIVADEPPAKAGPDAESADEPSERDSSAPAPDLPWDVFEAALPPEPPAPEPPPVVVAPPPPAPSKPASKPVSKTDSLMKLPRVPVDELPPTPAAPPVPAHGPSQVEDFIPQFHTPTDELPPVKPDEVDFIPHFHTPTDELPPVPDEAEVEAEAAAEIVDEDIPPIRRAEDSLTPGILRRVPDVEEDEDIPPIRRTGRAARSEDEAAEKESLALEEDTAGGLPRLRRMVDEVTGEVIDADWVREVGAEDQPVRAERRERGRGRVEEAIAERLEARRAQARSRPGFRLSTRTLLTAVSLLALLALAIYVPMRLGLFGGKPGAKPTPTVPAVNPSAPAGTPFTGAAAPGAGTPSQALQGHQQGRLTFASDRDGSYEIYVMDMASGAITRLTNNKFADRSPSWSPDGRQIAYVSNSSGNDDLTVIPAAGGTPVQLTTDPGSDRNPAWSPNGHTIVATRENVDGSRLMSLPTVCIAQPTTCESQMKVLTPGGYDRFPAWSPNGSKLAFTASDLPGGASVIALLNPDGSGYVSFPGTRTSDLSPAWSPNGKRIAFLSYAEGDYDLWIMNSDGTGVTQLTKSQATDGAPAWSPDGRYIVFASDRGDKQHFNLYLLQTDCIGSGTSCEDNLIRLTNGASDDLDPAWTP